MQHTNRGVFIILEGGEGAGKSTLARGLARTFETQNIPVVATREPGGTPWGEKIRSLLLDKDISIDHRMSPATQLLGVYMSRFEHLERVIVPALLEGKVVISDRFELSSYAYQVHAQGDESLARMFRDLHAHVTERLKPFQCVYLYCDIHPEVGLARVDTRGDTKTIFDEASLDFHHRVRDGMVRGQMHLDEHFRRYTLDASQDAEALLVDALKVLSQSTE